jgi:Copper transport outer membrane protein, MctB
VIDFRYHLVSIVAVFLALAIGIVLGSTELQGTTIDGLRASSNSLNNQLTNAEKQRDSYEALSNASNAFIGTSESKLLSGYLAGDRLVIVTEPGAPASVVAGVEQAAGLAGATVTGEIALQPRFNDLSGATQSSLNAINGELAGKDGTTLNPASSGQTVNQQQAAQLIATATLNTTAGEAGLSDAQAKLVLATYAQQGYLTTNGSVTDRATLAVVVTPQTASTEGSADPVNQVLLALAQELAPLSGATIVAGSLSGSATSGSAIQVLRASSVSGAVSTVDNADTTMGQISSMLALGSQLAGQSPASYGISGASAVSPVPSSAPSASPAATAPSSSKATASSTATASAKATGKVKATVAKK